MEKAKDNPDQNLNGVVDDLEQTVVNSHHAQQLQQDKMDRRHQDAKNRNKTTSH